MTVTEARERVARGAALLDAKRPGWAQQINVGTLDLRGGCSCVLGQVYGSFDVVLEPEFVCVSATTHGFSLYAEAQYDTPEGWRTLQDAWIEAIADRIVTGERDSTSGEVQEIRLADVPPRLTGAIKKNRPAC